ncbi:hypothetical protein M1N61_02155 [Peptococcaceae bacterium]|nr:hypothetical protein [Peptococcaceae bacterium]
MNLKFDLFNLISVVRRAAALPPAALLLGALLVVFPLLVVPNPVTHQVCLGAQFAPYVLPPDYFYFPRWVALLVVAVPALVLLLFRYRGELRHRALIPLGLFIGLFFVSAVLAEHSHLAWFGSPVHWTGLSTYLAVVLLFLLAFAATRAGHVPVEGLLRVLVFAAAVVGLLAVLQYFGLHLVPREEYRAILHTHSTMAMPVILGWYCAFALPAAAWFYLVRPRAVELTALVLIWLGLIVSFSWFSWLAALPGLLLVGLMAWRAGAAAAWPALLAGLVLVLAAGWLWLAGGGVPEFQALSERSVRSPAETLAVWSEVGRLFVQQPQAFFTGIGPDHLLYQGIVTPDRVLVDKARSMYLETAVTLGVPALLALLAFLSFCLRPPGSALQGVLLAMVVVYLVHGLFAAENLLVLPLFWVVLGLLLGLRLRAERKV